MEAYQEKINLLQEMIAFALVDGELHDKEYDFIQLVAQDLEIENAVLQKLFNKKGSVSVIKDEFNRICQFYRLALLMHADGVLSEDENIKISEMGIAMGLNPDATRRVLNLMETTENDMIDAETLLAIFKEQYN